MKNIIIYFLLISMCTTTSVRSSLQQIDCDIDWKFYTHYMNCIAIININQNSHQSGYVIDSREVAKALICITSITNTEFSVSHDTDYVYPDSTMFIKDLKLWNNWLEENKCSFTFDDAEKIFDTKHKEYLQSYSEEEIIFFKDDPFLKKLLENSYVFPNIFPKSVL